MTTNNAHIPLGRDAVRDGQVYRDELGRTRLRLDLHPAPYPNEALQAIPEPARLLLDANIVKARQVLEEFVMEGEAFDPENIRCIQALGMVVGLTDRLPA